LRKGRGTRRKKGFPSPFLRAKKKRHARSPKKGGQTGAIHKTGSESKNPQLLPFLESLVHFMKERRGRTSFKGGGEREEVLSSEKC